MFSNTMNGLGESLSVALPLERAGRITDGIISIAIGIAWVFSAKNPYSGGWLFVMYGVLQALWWSAATYLVRVSETTLSIITVVLGFNCWTKNYPLSEISNLRVGDQSIFRWTRRMLIFERKGKTKIFGELSGIRLKPNSEKLLDPVYHGFPNLRPTPPDPTSASHR